MRKELFEKYQVIFYISAIAMGFVFNKNLPEAIGYLDNLLWPILGFLLFVTFTQVELIRLPSSFKDWRFVLASSLGNFVFLPFVAWLLSLYFSDLPPLQLGVLLVLLVPCTDWFITFTHLARGDTSKAIAITPLNLILQLILTPIYLWIILGKTFSELFVLERVITVFLFLIVLPLGLAFLLEKSTAKINKREEVVNKLSWFPVPTLSLVVFIIAASQGHDLEKIATYLPQLSFIFGIFLFFSIPLGIMFGAIYKLNFSSVRTLIFNFSTRNSFLILPLALVLTETWRQAILVIVFQSIIELFGMFLFVWLIPRIIK